LHHAICHVLGATFGIAHGDVNSVILPHAMAFNAPAAAEAMAQVAQALNLPLTPEGHGDPAAHAVVAWLRDLQAMTGVPTRLRDLGIPKAALPTIAQKTLHERGLAYNPRPVNSAGDIDALLSAAW
jgi:alcohol dehydrogenase